jgi:branched-chain amino acid transport system permease protein
VHATSLGLEAGGSSPRIETPLSSFIQVTVAGLATGGLYALMMVGLLLVWQVSRNMNFAYGQIGMVGAFAAFLAGTDLGLPLPLALGLGVVAATLLSAAVESLVIRRIPERGGYDVVVTLGLMLLLTALVQAALGANARVFYPLATDVRVLTGEVFINLNDILCILIGAAAVIAAWFLLQRTSLGTSLRAASADSDLARSVGIDVRFLRTAVWAVSAVLVAVAAYFFASRLSLNAFYMQTIIINVFLAGMIGGLDRFWAPIVSAFGIALYQAWAGYLLGVDWSTPALFVLVIAIFTLVPRRLLEERHEQRA